LRLGKDFGEFSPEITVGLWIEYEIWTRRRRYGIRGCWYNRVLVYNSEMLYKDISITQSLKSAELLTETNGSPSIGTRYAARARE
jgi:hypothetical protein